MSGVASGATGGGVPHLGRRLSRWLALLSMLGLGGAGDAAAAATSSGLDIGSIVQSVVGGGAGGGILVAIVGAIKKALVK